MMDIEKINNMIENLKDKGEISDGSHTFNELYYHRMILFSVICNSFKDKCYKSKLHSDGTMYPGYFIVGIRTPEGDYSYHYKLKHWDMFDVRELENAPEWDGHEPKDVTRLISLLKPNYDEWLKKEIELACENSDGYYRAIYNSAAKAYMSLSEDGHSGMSIGLTKGILNRMIDRKPLTPISGTDDEWSDILDRNEERGYTCYQNKRYSALFKYIYDNGEIRYSDVNQFVCEDVNNPNIRYTSGYIKDKVQHLFPINMPYTPSSQPIVIYVEDFLTDERNGDYDTTWIMYLKTPEGTRIDINIFLAEIDGDIREISREEYLSRKENKIR